MDKIPSPFVDYGLFAIVVAVVGLGIWKVSNRIAEFLAPLIRGAFEKHSEFVSSVEVTNRKNEENARAAQETSKQVSEHLLRQTVLIEKVSQRIEQHDEDMSDRVKKIQTAQGCKYVPVTHGTVPKSQNPFSKEDRNDV